MSILSAKMIPSLGGNTEFLSMRAGYNALPQELKLKIDDKICWHDYSHGRSKIDPNLVTPEEKQLLLEAKTLITRGHALEALYQSYIFDLSGEKSDQLH